MSTEEPDNAVAIVGMALRLPGVDGIEALWRDLCTGQVSIRDRTAQELLSLGEQPERLWDPAYVARSGLLEGIDQFDAAFFGFSRADAAATDPQHRLLLECAYEALLDSGHTPSYAEGDIGVYCASTGSSYLDSVLRRPHALPRSLEHLKQLIANNKDYLATKISYKLDLKGPSINVATACSSSLVAVHLACTALLGRETRLALAGGAFIAVPQGLGYLREDGSMTSPDGHIRVFDRRANGTVFSSGVGCVALKRLDDARAEGDAIYAIIRGTAVNNDGRRKVGYTAPSFDGYRGAVRSSLQFADVRPDDVCVVEAHGTGTVLGDAIELQVLDEVYSRGHERAPPCYVGSIKGNIGHLDSAAGVLGLIKAALCLWHRRVPPLAGLERVNDRVDLSQSRLRFNSAPVDLPAQGPLYAGVSSLGIGGTNAHAVLQSANAAAPRVAVADASDTFMLPLSARSERSLAALARRYAEATLEGGVADVCSSAARGRDTFDHRLAVWGRSIGELQQRLRDSLSRRSLPPGAEAARALEAERARRLLFLFPGQGSQYAAMSLGLRAASPVYAAQFEACRAAIAQNTGLDLLSMLERPAAELQSDPVQAQLALFAVQTILAASLAEHGVRPSAVIGHSAGEIAAAHVAGALDFAEAIDLVCARAELMQRCCEPGRMATLTASGTRVLESVERELGFPVPICAWNAVTSGGSLALTIGQTPERMALVEQALARHGVTMGRLPLQHAFHSFLMDPMLPELRARIAGIGDRTLQVPLLSTVSGEIERGRLGADHWIRHVRQPVQFAAACDHVAALHIDGSVEIGPGRSLSILLGLAGVAPAAERATHCLVSAATEVDDFHGTLCRLWEQGYPVMPVAARHQAGYAKVRLPTYCFDRERHWFDGDAAGAPAAATAATPIGLEGLRPVEACTLVEGITLLETRLVPHREPVLADHRIDGRYVVPGAYLVELMRRAASAQSGTMLTEISFVAPLDLGAPAAPIERLVQVRLEREGRQVRAAVFGRIEDRWQLHAEATIASLDPASGVTSGSTGVAVPVDPVSGTEGARIFAQAQRSGAFEFGPSLQCAMLVEATEHGLRAQLAAVEPGAAAWVPLIDASLQLIAHHRAAAASAGSLMPSAIGAIEMIGEPTAPTGPTSVEVSRGASAPLQDPAYEVSVRDARGHLRLRLRQVVLRAAHRSSGHAPRPCQLQLAPVASGADAACAAMRPTMIVVTSRPPAEQAPRLTALLGGQPHAMLVLPAALEAADVPGLLAEAHGRLGGPAAATGHDLLVLADAGTDLDGEVSAVRRQWLPFLQGLAQGQLLPERLRLLRSAPATPIPPGTDPLASLLHSAAQELGLPFQSLRGAPAAMDQMLARGFTLAAMPAADGDFHADGRQLLQMRFDIPAAAPAGAGPAREELAVVLAQAGRIEDIRVLRQAVPLPRDGEVQLEVAIAPLNFKDVLHAIAALDLNDADGSTPLGLECVGRVDAIGRGVVGLSVGDWVLARRPGVLRRRVNVPAGCLLKLPAGAHPELVCSVPLAYLTAYHALVAVAGVRAGTRVLVHNGAGGVGHAAMAICRHLGAELFVTASRGKWPQLRALGVRHLYDSRSSEFRAAILRDTDGAGVDVVLNSQKGARFIDSLDLVRPARGILIDLAKGNAAPSDDATVRYYAYDLADEAHKDRSTLDRLQQELVGLVLAERLPPIPTRLYRPQDARRCFEDLARGEVIGKVGIDFREDAAGDADTVLVFGGLSAVGRTLARLYAGRGHRVMLTTREPDAKRFEQAREQFGALAPRIEIVTCTPGDAEQLAALAERLHGRQLHAVVYCPGVVRDRTLATMQTSDFEAPLDPKYHVLKQVLDALPRWQPREFVFVSSTAALGGSGGQANYAYANALGEALCARRLPPSVRLRTLYLGPLAAAAGDEAGGMYARLDPQLRQRLESGGLGVLSPDELRETVGAALDLDLPAAVIARIIAPADRETRATPQPVADGSEPQRLAASQAPLPDGATLRTIIREELLDLIRVPQERLSNRASFLDMGVDSLGTVELRNRLQRRLQRKLPAMIALDHPSVEKLAVQLGLLAQRVAEAPTPAASPPTPKSGGTLARAAAPASDADLEHLGAADLSALLEKELLG